MGKPTGFMEYDRQTAGYRPAAERVRDYNDVALALPEDKVSTQGARCMDCGIPYCHALGCPVINLIPEWNDLVYRGKWREALQRLEITNNLPEITGRVCPAPCETACTMSINSPAVTIKQIELAIVEKGWREGWVVPRPPRRETGRRVAIVGSGPSGLAAAQQLRRRGHQVTVYEKMDRVGGILRYGIPNFKLEKWIIDRRVAQMEAEGVKFETGVVIGEDISTRYLRKRYDAILLAVGAGQPRDLNVPGRGLDGICFAMDFLSLSNRFVMGELREDQIVSAKNKVVLVVGGGDTGSDCVGTSIRHGAKEVHQYEILPKPREWTQSWNPEWPDWPNILRTSSSHEEGCQRKWCITTKQFAGTDVHVREAQCCEVEWQRPRKAGPPVPMEKPGTEFTLKVDLVLLAMGFVHVEHSKLLEDIGLEYDERGNVKTFGYQSSVPGVFAAGDADIGASLVVRAIYHGREAAKSIDEYLGR
jgi:glutamate synthase (NADPH) small chain